MPEQVTPVRHEEPVFNTPIHARHAISLDGWGGVRLDDQPELGAPIAVNELDSPRPGRVPLTAQSGLVLRVLLQGDVDWVALV